MIEKSGMEVNDIRDFMEIAYDTYNMGYGPDEVFHKFDEHFPGLDEATNDTAKYLLTEIANNSPLMDFKGKTRLQFAGEMSGSKRSILRANVKSDGTTRIDAMGIPVNDKFLGKNMLRMPIRKEAKIYPNSPCPCGSGKKYKQCCGKMK